MGFGAAVRSGLSKYATFRGRARRSEFWWFTLFAALVVVAGIALDAAIGTNGIFYGLTLLALFLPNLAVSVRRLHDLDKSGWAYLLYLIPLVGFVLLIVFNVQDGTPGPNRYGQDPKGGTMEYGFDPMGQTGY